MKKTAAVLFALLLIITALTSVPALAISDNEKLKIVIDGSDAEITALPGDITKIAVRLVNNVTVSSIKISLTFDENLTVAEENGDPKVLFPIKEDEENSTDLCKAVFDEKNGCLVLNWMRGDGEKTGDCVFAEVYVQVSGQAQPDDFMQVTAYINPNDIFDKNYNNIEYELISGGVKVSNFTVGDVDGNGKLNNKDVTALFRYITGIYSEKDILKAAADFDGDGKTNNKDVVLLFRYITENR